MKRMKITLTLNLKTDPEDPEQIQRDVREELAGLLDSDEDIEFDTPDEQEDEDSEEDFS